MKVEVCGFEKLYLWVANQEGAGPQSGQRSDKGSCVPETESSRFSAGAENSKALSCQMCGVRVLLHTDPIILEWEEFYGNLFITSSQTNATMHTHTHRHARICSVYLPPSFFWHLPFLPTAVMRRLNQHTLAEGVGGNILSRSQNIM